VVGCSISSAIAADPPSFCSPNAIAALVVCELRAGGLIR
jgi:hypothetical protein